MVSHRITKCSNTDHCFSLKQKRSPNSLIGFDVQQDSHNPATTIPRHRPAPLAPLAIGLMIGIALDAAFTPSWNMIGLLAIVTITSVLLACRLATQRNVTISPTIYRVACFGLAAVTGLVHHAHASRFIPMHHISRLISRDATIMTLEGTIVNRPYITEDSDRRLTPYPLPPKTRFTLRNIAVQSKTGMLAVDGRVAVSVKEPMLFLQAGDGVRIIGRLYQPQPPANPGAFDWAALMRRRGIHAALSTDHAAALTVIDRDSNGISAMLHRARIWAGNLLHQDSELIEDNAAGAVSAMVLGQRSQVDRDLNEAFVRTGGAHFLAASGMHVGWLALMGWWLARFIGLHYRAAAMLTAGIILSYVLLAEPRPSILRAGIIAILACISIFRRGHIHTGNWLGTSAIILLLINPLDLFNVAFQLSFVAVLAIVYLMPPIEQWIGTKLPFLRGQFENQAFADTTTHLPLSDALPSNRRLALDAVVIAIRITIAASIAAWLANLPLVTYHFDRFAPWGWLFNLILIIPAFLLTVLGFAKVLSVAIIPSLAAPFAILVDLMSRLFIGLVERLAQLPGTLLPGNRPSLFWVAACYTIIVLFLSRPALFRRRWILPSTCLALLIWWQIPHRLFVVDRGALNIWALAIGDGTATVIELPDGRVLLFDFGTRTPLDATQVGVDFLHHRGIRRISTVFVSHANWDHYGAIEGIADAVAIDNVVLSAQYDQFATQDSGGWRFRQSIAARDIPISTAAMGQTWHDASTVTIETIWPPPAEERAAPSANDGSLALRLTFANKRILITGDQAEWGLGGMLADCDLACDVLILPHHGSVVHNTQAFIDAANADINIRSSGQRQNMTTNNIENIVGPNRQYFNTADEGCVRIRITADEIKTTTQFNK